MKKAFSLAEMLMVLTIMGILISFSIPMLTSNFGNINTTLYKTARDLTKTVADEVTVSGGISNTFCNKFAEKVNTVGAISCTSSNIPDSPNFVTSNKMKWYGLEDIGAVTFNNALCDNAETGLTGNCIKARVDINGVKTPNTLGDDILNVYVNTSGDVRDSSGGEGKNVN